MTSDDATAHFIRLIDGAIARVAAQPGVARQSALLLAELAALRERVLQAGGKDAAGP